MVVHERRRSVFQRAISATVRPFEGDDGFAGAGLMASVVGAWGIEALYGIAVASGAHWVWDAVRTFCLLWFASGAAFFLGTIAGFLFGVPKVATAVMGAPSMEPIQQEATASPIAPARRENRFRANTNLEDISDWFTKIIVGLGLANVASGIAFVSKSGDLAADAMGNPQGAKVIAISAMTYGFISGFLIAYIWAGTNLRAVFEHVETN